MKYRRFKAADTDVSLLGFGAMRLPLLKGTDDVDEAEAIKMIRYAIDNGVNYIDTAYVYHHQTGESIVGKALKDGYREKVLLATKMPYWFIDGPEEMDGLFEEQLNRLRVDHFDMYLVHDIRSGCLDIVKEWKVWDFISKKRDEGKVRFIGFSSHCDTPEYFKEILDSYPWDFCQIQFNFMDKDKQAGLKGYEYAVSKDVPVIVMEPLKGGKLTDIIKPSIMKKWDELGSGRTPAEWALRWVADFPGVLTILSGMSAIEQVKENIRVLSDAEACSLSDEELASMEDLAGEYQKLILYQCTDCKYCLPCTVSIDIPDIMNYRNSCELFGISDNLQNSFRAWAHPKPSVCTECGKCEEDCPQHLEIRRVMRETTELLG